MRGRSPARLLVLALAAALIAVATLTPLPGQSTADFCPLFCHPRGTADNIANVLLFLPFGAALALTGLRPLKAGVVGMLVSLMVETAQLLVISGRDSTPADLISNTVGAALGAWFLLALPRLLRPATEGFRRKLLAGAVTAAAATIALTGYLQSPWFPNADYYGQWNQFRGSYHAYSGTVLAASVGMEPIPRAGPAAPGLRNSLRAGEPFRVLMLAGPEMDWQAQIARVGFGTEDVIFLAASGDDLILRYRSHAAALRLDQPTVRLRDGLSGIAPGDRLVVQARRDGAGYCLSAGERWTCTPLAAGSAWQLIQSSDSYSAPIRAAAGALVMALLWLPIGVWTRRDPQSVVTTGLAALAVLLLPPLVGLAIISPLEAAGGAGGFLLGLAVVRWSARGRAGPRPDPMDAGAAQTGQSGVNPATARISESVS